MNACGLYDLDRKPRPVAGAYRELLQAYGHLAALGNSDLFRLAAGPPAGGSA